MFKLIVVFFLAGSPDLDALAYGSNGVAVEFKDKAACEEKVAELKKDGALLGDLGMMAILNGYQGFRLECKKA